MTILLIRTGGTFDSEAYADPHHPPKMIRTLKGEKSPLNDWLPRLDTANAVELLRWQPADEDRFVKDSKLFTDEDISALADRITTDPRSSFIITHGTDAIAKNASRLAGDVKGGGKVIVFVSAIVPLSMNDKYPSDGIDTLRFAIEKIGTLPPGIYIASADAEGKRSFFAPQEVEKDWDLSLKRLRFTLKPIA